MQDVFIEYMVKKKSTPRTILLRAAILLAAALLMAAALLLGGAFGSFSFVLPLILIGAGYGAYFLLTSLDVEFEYAVTNGEMDVDQIVAKRRRKRLLTINFREAEAFGKYRPEEYRGGDFGRRLFYCDHPDSPELWCCVVRTREAGKVLLVFNANEKMLAGIKPFLPRTVLR